MTKKTNDLSVDQQFLVALNQAIATKISNAVYKATLKALNK